MAEARVIKVRVCGDCGEVVSMLDTVCQRCWRPGTLRDRFQCQTCRTVLDDKTCMICAGTGIRTELESPGEHRGCRRDMGDETDVPSVADPTAPPPWLAGLVGGGVFGAAAGAVAAMLFGESMVLGALIGIVPGGLVGLLVSGSTQERK